MSYAQQFSDQATSFNAGLNSYFASVQENYRTEVANAGRVNDDLLAFAELGQTVAGKLEERKNYLIKQSKLKYYNAARELVATGQFELPTGESPEEKEEFNLRIDQAIKARQEGKPVEFGHKLLNIGEHDRRHFQLGLIADVAAQQDTIMKQIIKDEGLPTGTERELAGSMATAFTRFMDQNLMSFDERVVMQAMPTFNKTLLKTKQGYTSANNIRNSEFTLQRTKAEFGLGVIDYGQSLKLLQGVLNPKNGKNYTSADANKIMVDHLKNLAKQGALSRAVEDNYFSSKPSWGGGKTLAELKPDLYNEIQSLKIDYQSNKADTVTKRAAREAAADADAIMGQYYEKLEAGVRPTDAWQELQLDEWRQKHVGQNEDWLATLITQEEFTQLEKFENAEGIAERDGYIIDTHPDLKGLTANQRNTLSPFIKSEAEVKEITTEKGFAEKRIDAVIKTIPSSYGTDTKEFTDQGIVLKQNALRELDRRIAIKVGQGQTYQDAIQNSAQEIVDTLVTIDDKGRKVPNPEFDTYKNNRVNTSAFRQDLARIGRAMLDTPLNALTPGQYQIPQDVATHLERQAKGLEKDDHDLIKSLADLDPRMSRLDVKRWMHKNLSAPYKPQPIDEAFEQMSYAVPSLRKVYAGGPAMATQMQIETGNTLLTYNHPEAVHPALRASAEDPYYHAIGINEGNLDQQGNPTIHYGGHTDPGDNARNIGIFSASSSRQSTKFNTPEEADAYHKARLETVRQKYRPVLASYGVPMTTDDYHLFMFNILDLQIQAPLAVPDFVKSLRTVIDLGLDGEELVEAVGYQRARAYINPRTGKLETSFKSFEDLQRDQTDRAGTILSGQRGVRTRRNLI